MNVSKKTMGLLALACLALALRVWVVLALSSEHAAPLTYEHGRIAENLLAGRGFSIEFLGTEGPTSQQAPFYPLLLAAVYVCFGVGTPAALLAVQLIQCVAGTGLVLGVVWLAWSLLPERDDVGWVAGLGAAVYPTHLYMVTHCQVALWAALLLVFLLATVVSPRWRATWPGAILTGSLAGALLLVEPILALALPICAAAFWLGEGRLGERQNGWKDRFQAAALGRLAAMASVALLVVAPWIARNWMVHGEAVFIKSTFGYALWQGNNPHSWGTDKIPKPSAELLRNQHDGSLRSIDQALWEARHETLYIDDVLLGPTGYREFVGLTEPERSRLLGRRALAFIRGNPGRYGRLCLARLRYFLLFDETNPKAANFVYRWATVSWLVLGFIGFLVSLPRAGSLWAAYAIFAAVTLFHALVITSVRFRIPIEPVSFVWAAFAVTPFLARFWPRSPIQVYRPGERSGNEPGAADTLRGPHWRSGAGRRAA